MGLGNLSNIGSKIQSFRYDKVGPPAQTFEDGHSGTVVTGNQNKVRNVINNSSPNDGTGYGNIMSAISTNPTPQTFTVSHRGGEATITGLQGSVPSILQSVDFNSITDSSNLMQTWKNSFDGANVYSVPRKTNPTTGHNELTFTYGNVPDPEVDGNQIEKVNGAIERYLFGPPSGRGLGTSAYNANPTRFSKEFGPNWTVNTAFGMTRGGSASDAITNNYTDLVLKSSWWSNFVSKQSDLQSSYTIMSGEDDIGMAPFDQFDGLGISVGFAPGTRGVRIGNIFQGIPKYLENAPFINKESTPYGSPFVFDYSEIGNPNSPAFPKSDYSGFGEPNFGTIPKLAYLYENYVVAKQDDITSSGLAGMLDSFIDNSLNPYPVAPTQNIVKSGENFENVEDDGDLSKRYSLHGLRDIPHDEDTKLLGSYLATLRSPYEKKYLEGKTKQIEELKRVRESGASKVYAIGRQGFKSVNDVSELVEVSGSGFEGLIKQSPGARKYFTNEVDQVNMIPYGKREGGASGNTDVDDLDFVPLVFHDIFKERDIVFRSILGDITDTITPNWSEQSFVGRPVKSAIYTGVGRTIGFDFKVYPKTKQEFPVLLEKVNYLVGLCYPHLDKFYRQTGPLIKLTLGDIIDNQMGYITGCTVTFPSDSTWETDKGLRFTKMINVSVEYTYIGGNIPVATGKHYGLGWLEGTQYNENGVDFEEFPKRTAYNDLFKDLGQE